MQEYSPRRLLFILAVICVGSLSMHAMVFKKRKDLHYRHFDPKPQSMQAIGRPVEGTVLALGMDRLHIKTEDSPRLVFRCEEPARFKVGQRVRATFGDGPKGEAPYAVRVEAL
jgi:hypothetical protein